MTKDLPLVSYCVKCYNQERYIGDALRAAFAQTYSPLEILICDDASTDRSDEVIRKMISEYENSGGRHEVRYFRNKKNLGNLGNWQHMCELAKGVLLVKADGDDYSAPERTAKLVGVWIANGKIDNELISDGTAVSESGRRLWDIKWHAGLGLGGFAAFSRRCFTEFPALIEGVSREGADDVVYIGRNEMLGGTIGYVPESLVFYRQGSGETSTGIQYVKMMTRGFRFMIASSRQLLADAEYVRLKIGETSYERFRRKFEWSIRHHQALFDLWAGETLKQRMRGFVEIVKIRSFSPAFGIFLLLPRWITVSVLNTLYWARCQIRCFMFKS